ncbi:MAG: Uma2 family endonuclease [Pyrinomonadaceae bacterium]|nr:Uma2 family endonuclease [Pyrinomonadaceae bacterium]
MTPTRVFTNWQNVINIALENQKPVVLYGVTWDDYKNLHNTLGNDFSGLRTYFSKGVLEIIPSSQHEFYADFVKKMLTIIEMRLRKPIAFFGSATIESDKFQKGAEPDASFFVSRAKLVSGKIKFNIAEIPPDIVVEIDVFNTDFSKFEIYAAFDVKEFWRYDEKELTIFRLENGEYEQVERSVELPVLSAGILTEYLKRSQTQDQFDVLNDFETWLLTENK